MTGDAQRGGGRATCEAVRYSDILAIILTQEHTDHTFPCAFGRSSVVVCDREQDKGSNRDGACHEGESLRRRGRHGGRRWRLMCEEE